MHNLAIIYTKNHIIDRATHNYFISLDYANNMTEGDVNRSYYNLACSLFKSRDISLAKSYLNVVLESNPNHIFGNRLKSQILIHEQNFSEAKLALLKARENEKEFINNTYSYYSTITLNTLEGYVNGKLGDLNSSINMLENEISNHKNNYLAHRYLGEIYHLNNDLDKSCYHLNKAKKLDYSYKMINEDLNILISEICEESTLNTEKQNKQKNLNIKIYPNPTTDFLTFDNLGDEIYEYKVFSINNRLLKKGKLKKNQKINVRRLPSGLNYIQLNNSSKEFNFKFLKE